MIKPENYFDNCATTRVDDDVARIMSDMNCNMYFNPSSLSGVANDVSSKLRDARRTVCNVLGEGNVIFTSSGTEADNLAILGAIKNNTKHNIVTSLAEHPAVLHTVKALKSRGFDIRYAPLNRDGSVNIDGVKALIDKDTQMVALMHVNNQTGAVTDIKSISNIARSQSGALVFCDGVQSFTKTALSAVELGVDMYAMSAHKIHAAKGVGALWVKKGIHITPVIYGGGQENGLRSGTENVAGIVGFALAIEKAMSEKDLSLRYGDYSQIIKKSLADIGGWQAASDNSIPAVLTVLFEGIKSEVVAHILEDRGFIVGVGSACSSKEKGNALIEAVGLRQYREGLIRISFSKYNTTDSVKAFAEALREVVGEFRRKARL